MKPPELAYVRATGKADALDLLAGSGPDARVLAGGQSLVPMLNLRVARPSRLVDIGRVEELNRLGVVGGELVVGALVRHHVLERHPLVAEEVPVLALAAGHIGHPAIRHRGTLGGSLGHADPSGELMAVAMLLDATVVVESQAAGTREVAARDLVVGPYETVLGHDELITWLRLPRRAPGRAGFHEVVRRPGDFAVAGAAVWLPDDPDAGPVAVTFGAGTGYRLTRAPGGAGTDPERLAALLAAGTGAGERLRRVAVERAVRAAGDDRKGTGHG